MHASLCVCVRTDLKNGNRLIRVVLLMSACSTGCVVFPAACGEPFPLVLDIPVEEQSSTT